ncbi:flagellar filament capping protein FliD [Ruminiclostridium cellulolyticum]|uniref:Flagellar hook-associated protein 2 n=1 Tax=Ruminiclostridium cellulolyticum (strain ATCC 35319 / DSM 5812 / JCM 6584 / H10) TaxID=394503 RepID=B8I4D9_RUMCH|nr:flagellar filament capping protein FliD [Ruminiclostridium cellulolyticum]ACL74493.1 flagellar hook-associated 2 domain protein [Ruminiclostridium cellulolyticum H10]
MNINSSGTNGLQGTTNYSRLTGMVSGFDTDGLVKASLSGDQAKIDKIKQSKELNMWMIDAYRDVTSSLQSFYNQFFDSVTSTTNLKLASTFSSYNTVLAAGSPSDVISVTAGVGVRAGVYSLSNIVAATNARISTGTDITKTVETGVISQADLDTIKSSNYNNIFKITLNGKTADITLDNDAGQIASVDDLVSQLQGKLNAAFGVDSSGNGKVKVENNGGKLKFTTVRNTDSFTIGTINNAGANKLFSTAPTETTPFDLNGGNNQFELTIGNNTKTVTVPPLAGNSTFTTADDLKAAIQNGIDAAFGAGSGITAEVNNGKVVLKSESAVNYSIGNTANGATNAILQIDSSNISNKVDLNTKLSSMGAGFAIDPFKNSDGTSIKNEDGTFSKNIEFTITSSKGTSTFSFDPATTSINDIMRKVNMDTTANATMSYDVTTNSFRIQAKDTGATSKLDIVDTAGGFMSSLGISGTGAVGSDASVTVTGDDGTSMTIVRPDNSFTYAGLTFNISKDLPIGADPIKVTVSGDTSKTFNTIKSFVDQYNALIDKLNTKISEKKERSYLPLTEAQKASMTTDQIEKWEVKAKTGLLQGNTDIQNTLDRLRTALYDSVEGVGISLYSIGITTSTDYRQKGKLVIDESKLKEALANNPDEVTNLFTAASDKSYYKASGDYAIKRERYRESGLADRFSDIIQDAIRTTPDARSNPGTLIMKAGQVGDASEYTNSLIKEILGFDKIIDELNAKLTSKENALYAKYANMEKMLSRMSAQSGWLASQFGGQ